MSIFSGEIPLGRNVGVKNIIGVIGGDIFVYSMVFRFLDSLLDVRGGVGVMEDGSSGLPLRRHYIRPLQTLIICFCNLLCENRQHI